MQIAVFLGLLVGALLLNGCADLDKQKIGTATGAVVGGIAGNKVSNNSNRALGTLAGVAVGAFIGNRVGKYLSDVDQKRAAEASAKTAETGKPQSFKTESGTTVTTSAAPAATTAQAKTGSFNPECRIVRQSVVLQNGTRESEDVKLCNGPNGWQPA